MLPEPGRAPCAQRAAPAPACRGGGGACLPAGVSWAGPIFPGLPAGSLSFNKMSEYETTLLLQPANELAVSFDSPRVWGYSASCEGKTD